MTSERIAFDLTQAKLGRIGSTVYTESLLAALTPLLGERIVPIASRLARPVAGANRTLGQRLATLGRDLWWHQAGVTLAARRRSCRLLHLPAGLGPVASRFPVVVTVHDIMPIRFPEFFRPWYRSYVGFVLPRLARRARALICGSEAARQELVEWIGIPAERATVIPYGVDSVFRPLRPDDPAVNAVRRRYDLPHNFVLAVGSVEPRKNLPRLLDALRRLREQPETADVALVHAGPEGWQPEVATEAARRLGVDSITRFLGYVPVADLAALYGLARVFAFPSLWEGFGIPVLEAMACGCPVVTSRVSSLPEVAGDAALLVDPTSPDAIAQAIAALWHDGPVRSELIERGLAHARRFTWERTAAATAAVYEAVLSGNGAPSR